MVSTTTIERRGTTLPAFAARGWRELAAAGLVGTSPDLLPGALAGAPVVATATAMGDDTDHTYSTRPGSSSCSPPV